VAGVVDEPGPPDSSFVRRAFCSAMRFAAASRARMTTSAPRAYNCRARVSVISPRPAAAMSASVELELASRGRMLPT
jgi:hypothetical protein